MSYFFKVRWWMKLYSPHLLWRIPTEKKEVFLTFDDGPVSGVTNKVLQILDEYQAKASFFCLGKRVKGEEDLFTDILNAGHVVGNHSYDHPDGWKTTVRKYVSNVYCCEFVFGSPFFRPPYGKISYQQIKALKNRFTIVMWSQLSGDFDPKLSADEILVSLQQNTKPGEIIVFHDNAEAGPKMLEVLPKYLAFLKLEGYTAEVLRKPKKKKSILRKMFS